MNLNCADSPGHEVSDIAADGVPNHGFSWISMTKSAFEQLYLRAPDDLEVKQNI